MAPPYPQPTTATTAATTAGVLQAFGSAKIGIRAFEGPARLENCRGLKPLSLPADVSPTLYVQKAFETEFSGAGLLAASSSDLTLTGRIDTLNFSSTKLLTMGQWTIALSLRSSNGKTLQIQESYEFDSAFEAREACRYTADAFAQTVQRLVAKTFADPGFANLLRQQ